MGDWINDANQSEYAAPTDKAIPCRICNGTWFKDWAYRPAVRRLAIFGIVFRKAEAERLETTCAKCGYVASHRPGVTEVGQARGIWP